MSSPSNWRSAALIGLLVLAGALTIDSLRVFATSADEGRDMLAFFGSALDFWQSGNAYEQRPFINLNPPHISILLFSPFVFLPHELSISAWFVVSMLAAALALHIVFRDVQIDGRAMLWVGAVCMASSAMQHTIRQGQVGTILMLFATLAWRATRHDEMSHWLTIAVSLKPWMGMWLILQRRPRALAMLAVGLAAIAISVPLVGLHNWRAWLEALQNNRVWPVPSNLSILGGLTRLSGQTTTGATVMAAWVDPTWVALSVIVVAVTWWRQPSNVDQKMLTFGLAAILISPVGWTYYLLILVGPLVAWGTRLRWPAPVVILVMPQLVPVVLLFGAWQYSSLLASLYTIGAVGLWSYAIGWPAQTAGVTGLPADTAGRPGMPNHPPDRNERS